MTNATLPSRYKTSDTPDSGIGELYWALELVSVLGPGTNYQVQTLDDMVTGGWTNVGGVVAGSGQELQHFISIRKGTNEFYRVIEAP